MGGIAILYNSLAGRHHSAAIAQDLSTFLTKRDMAYQCYGDDWPSDLSHHHAVWIIGGDGTLNYALNHVKGTIPPIVVFKGGTGNDFANLLYGRASVLETAEIALQAPVREVDAGICNGQYFVNIAGLGFEGDVLQSMQSIRAMGSLPGYYAAVIKVIFTFREPHYTIWYDDEDPVMGPLLLLMISNAPETGGGFRVSPLAVVNDGFLDVVSASPLTILKRLWALPKVRKGKHLQLPFVNHRVVKKLVVHADREIRAQVDGELITGKQFDFRVCPGRFQFLY